MQKQKTFTHYEVYVDSDYSISCPSDVLKYATYEEAERAAIDWSTSLHYEDKVIIEKVETTIITVLKKEREK